MLFNNKKLLRSQFTFKSDHHKIYTHKINKIVLNYFDDKRIQCNDKITAYPYGYFDNKKDINMKIKDNTVILNANDNSGIIPKNYNTKDPIEKDITSIPININKIIDSNNDNYADGAKSTCEDIIKSTINYADSIKSISIDIIKSYNVNNNYLDSIKSTTNDNMKSTNINNNYLDSIKSTTGDNIKSNNVNNKYIDSIKSKCADKNNIIAHHKNISNKSAHSKTTREINALLKSKKVTTISKNIIISKKTNHQAAITKHELSRLSKL